MAGGFFDDVSKINEVAEHAAKNFDNIQFKALKFNQEQYLENKQPNNFSEILLNNKIS